MGLDHSVLPRSNLSTCACCSICLAAHRSNTCISAERITILKLLASIRAAAESPAADEKQEL